MLLSSTEFQAKAGAYRNPDRWVLADLGDRSIWVNLSDRSVSFPCLQGDYEPGETRVVRRLVGRGHTFIDIGANIGWFSTLAAVLVGGEGEIVAFEPRPETFERLARTLDLTGVPHVAHRAGLSDRAGMMNLTWGQNTPNPGGSRLVHGDLPEGQLGTEVNLITLDSIGLRRCDFIKIDVEGAEMLALRGGQKTIETFRPLIMSEVHDEQLHSVSRCSALDYVGFMESIDYRCVDLDGELLDRAQLSASALLNVVFTPVEKMFDVKVALAMK